MAESITDKAAGARNTGNGSSSVRDCAGLRSSSSERSHGESDSIKTVAADETVKTSSFKSQTLNKDMTVLFLENVSQYLNFREIMETLSPFGRILRIKTIYKRETNNFYITFLDASSAQEAYSKLNNMKLAQFYLHAKIINKNNIRDSDDDFIPKPEFLTQCHPKRTQHHKIQPLYNLVTVEDSHNALKVFEFLNKQISSPKITPESFIRFGRNTYLVKVSKPSQGYMLRGQFKDFEDSGILDIKPFDEYNGSRGKIYNTDLAKLTPEELLDRCPENIVNVTNIKTFDKTTKTFINTPAIILKFSDNILPDQITIGPFRMRVKEYEATPRICKNCLRYGHTKKVCKKERLCFKCSLPHMELDDNVCTNASKCFHCSGDHWAFNKNCPEYIFQKEVCNKAYIEKTSIRQAKILLNRSNTTNSYAGATQRTKTGQNQRTGNNTSFWNVPSGSYAGAIAKTSGTTTTAPTTSGTGTPNTKSNASTVRPTNSNTNKSPSTTTKPVSPTKSSSESSVNRPTTTSTAGSASTAPIVASTVTTPTASTSNESESTKKRAKAAKNRSSSLLDLTTVEDNEDDVLSTETKTSKESLSFKTKDDSNIKTSNRFSYLSRDPESTIPTASNRISCLSKDPESTIPATSTDKKRKPDKTAEDLQSSQQSKKKIQLSDLEKPPKVSKSSSSKNRMEILAPNKTSTTKSSKTKE